MDEWTLNDLLECSVCLERLDTSSKVLPCQHTFCKKCLEEIVQTHKELRCPECRVLVDAKIDDLPPNVLLMRILEGMRNAGPKKRNTPGGNSRLPPPTQHPHNISQSQQQQQHTSLPSIGSVNHVPPEPTIRHQFGNKIPNQPYARAVYDYLSKEPGDLSFKKGDLIILRKKIDNNWYHGECGGSLGVFPLSYVEIITPLPSHVPQCKALYDFRMTNDDEEGCLTFTKGEVIVVIRRVDENWAEGKLGERIGIFPLAFVEMNSVARALMKLSSNAQPGPSRLAPPTPTTEDVTPLIPTDHSRTVAPSYTPASTVHQTQVQSTALVTLAGSDSSSSTTLTSPSSSSSSSTTPATSSSSTAPSSPTSPPPPPTKKRHSFSILHQPAPHPAHRHSAEILSNDTCAQNDSNISAHMSPQTNGSTREHERHRRSDGAEPLPVPQGSKHAGLQLPAAYVALYPYKPQKADELELKRGVMYTVTERCQDGWFKGTSSRSQKSGVFPGNYVAPAKSLSALQAQVRGITGISQKSNSPPAPPLQPRPRTAVSYTRPTATRPASPRQQLTVSNSGAPELPPRSVSPAAISVSWHGDSPAQVSTPRSHTSSVMSSSGSPKTESASPSRSPAPGQSSTIVAPPNISVQSPSGMSKSVDKIKEKKDRCGLMRRLTSMKKSKSPPPLYSMDNPVFEDGTTTTTITSTPNNTLTTPSHPVHVRPTVETPPPPLPSCTVSISNQSSHSHRKSNSLDSGSLAPTERKPKQLVPTVKERFRCIVPYPPNSEYELELRVGDVIYVHKKREDGWYKGTQQRTGKTGLFPASFVETF